MFHCHVSFRGCRVFYISFQQIRNRSEQYCKVWQCLAGMACWRSWKLFLCSADRKKDIIWSYVFVWIHMWHVPWSTILQHFEFHFEVFDMHCTIIQGKAWYCVDRSAFYWAGLMWNLYGFIWIPWKSTHQTKWLVLKGGSMESGFLKTYHGAKFGWLGLPGYRNPQLNEGL